VILLALFLALLLVLGGCQNFLTVTPMDARPLHDNALITRVALGSCFQPEDSDAIFREIERHNPDVFLFIGDNVYAEDESPDPGLRSLREGYGLLAQRDAFASLRESTPLLVTWDDHDYGVGDGGGDWDSKFVSEAIYERAWAVPHDDPRANRDGIYYARTVGPSNQRVQFIMLDTRFFRTRLNEISHAPYEPVTDPEQNLLGDEQWRWFEDQLRKPADVRIIATSIQLVATGHSWESWRMMPKEKQRFQNLLRRTNANGVILVSGDRHAAAIYKLASDNAYPLYELSTSSLNQPLTEVLNTTDIKDEPGPHRLGGLYYETNFGMIDIDWQARNLALSIRDDTGKIVLEESVPIDALKYPATTRESK
jgi:alkaline phosphatase D